MNQLFARDISFDCRIGTSDEKTFKEVVEGKAYELRDFKIEPGERWIDLGANAGAFTVLAAKLGAHVTSYEPDPGNVAMIKRNLALNGLTAEVKTRAVVHDDRPAATLNLWPGGQTWRNSLIRKKKGSVGMTVLCENFFKICEATTCVKMDIEGAEISILEAWPEGFRVKKLVFEYSFDVDNSCDRLLKIVQKLEKSFSRVKYPKQITHQPYWNFFPPCTTVFCS